MIYFSAWLQKDFTQTWHGLTRALDACDVAWRLIPDTRDVWCRDYMPVVGADGRLVQFVYYPQYLRSKKDARFITSPGCYRDLPFASKVQTSEIILDGGAIEICERKGIVSERVFEDNPKYGHEELLQHLQQTLGLVALLVIPVEPGDITGHVDGVVRFIDEQHVVMNDYTTVDGLTEYGMRVKEVMREAGLRISMLVYNPSDESPGKDVVPSATGCYNNFLRIGQIVLVPQFAIHTDKVALREFRQIFPGHMICPVDCSELARKGGVINCVSWRDRND